MTVCHKEGYLKIFMKKKTIFNSVQYGKKKLLFLFLSYFISYGLILMIFQNYKEQKYNGDSSGLSFCLFLLLLCWSFVLIRKWLLLIIVNRNNLVHIILLMERFGKWIWTSINTAEWATTKSSIFCSERTEIWMKYIFLFF